MDAFNGEDDCSISHTDPVVLELNRLQNLLKAKIQKLKDKLTISERTANAEAQVKDKLKLRLKTLEEGLRHIPGISNKTNGSPKNVKTGNLFGILLSNKKKKRSTSLPRASAIAKNSVQMRDQEQASIVMAEINPVNGLRNKYPSGESLLRKGLRASRNKVIDNNSEKENTEANSNVTFDQITSNCGIGEMGNSKCMNDCCKKIKDVEIDNTDGEDMVSGFLYDRLQKEVLNLRKSCESKDRTVNAKEEEIKAMLMKKTETLAKAIEVESRKIKREAAIREKDSTPTMVDDKLRNRSKPIQKVSSQQKFLLYQLSKETYQSASRRALAHDE